MAWAKAPFPDFDSPPSHWHSITALTLIPAKVIASVYQGGLFSSDFLTESIIRVKAKSMVYRCGGAKVYQ
jgi:hypothetical protein